LKSGSPDSDGSYGGVHGQDKVGRQRVGEEIATLRKELLDRHKEELKEAGIESQIDECTPHVEDMSLGGNAIYKQKKLSKQQEKR